LDVIDVDDEESLRNSGAVGGRASACHTKRIERVEDSEEEESAKDKYTPR
jgi:hypothetical protein